MYEDPKQEIQDNQQTSWLASVGWKSCLLLTVMLIGLFTTPLALLYRWYAAQPVAPEDSIFEVGGEVINRIAFVTSDRELATIDPDGEDFRRLAKLPNRLAFPAWSPDGSLLAITMGSNVYIAADVEAESQSNGLDSIYESSDLSPFYAYWSPDSSQLSFLTNHPDGLALHLADVSGGGASESIVAIGQPFYWDWTQDSDQLLIHSGLLGSNARLALIDDQGEGQDIANPGFFQAPGISQSGRLTAYAVLDESRTSHLIIQDVNGNQLISEPHLGQISLLWSPVDELLAISSPVSNSSANFGPLRIVDPVSNEIRSLTSDNVVAYFWSPDGRMIAYFTFSDRDFGGVQAQARPAKINHRARVQGQAQNLTMDLWVVDVESQNKQLLLKFSPSVAFTHQFLPFFDQYALSHRIWSPDSNALTIPILEEGVSHIAVVHLDREDIDLLAAGEIAFWSQQ